MTKKNPKIKGTQIIKDAKTVAKEQEAQQRANQKEALSGLADYTEIKSGKAKTEEKINEAKAKNPKAASAAKKDLEKLVKNTKLQTTTVLKKIEEKYAEIKQETLQKQSTQPYVREGFSGQASNLSSRDALIAQRQSPTQLKGGTSDIKHAYTAATFDPKKMKSNTITTPTIQSQNLPKNKTTDKNKGTAI